MNIDIKYIPEESPQINLFEDLTSCLNQLSDCYNEVIQDLQDKIKCQELERQSIIKALKDNNIEGLKTYFRINATY